MNKFSISLYHTTNQPIPMFEPESNTAVDTCSFCNGPLTNGDWLANNVGSTDKNGDLVFCHKHPCLNAWKEVPNLP